VDAGIPRLEHVLVSVHHRPGSGHSPGMNPQPPAGRRAGRRGLLIGAAGLAAVAATVALVSSAAADGRPPLVSSSGGARSVALTSGPVRTVELIGLAGKLTVTGTAGDRAELTGPVQWNGPAAPQITSRFDRLTGTLKLTSSCAAGSPCTAAWRLAVPRRASLVLFQPSGQVTLAGLAGPVRIGAASVDISATGLRSPSLVAYISSGHLAADFAAPPGRLAVTLASAQATIRLPDSVRYAVTSNVISGYLQNGIPTSATAARTISVRISSGEVALLPG
jgi:hypothetical protein